jgi:hypothetical protein
MANRGLVAPRNWLCFALFVARDSSLVARVNA